MTKTMVRVLELPNGDRIVSTVEVEVDEEKVSGRRIVNRRQLRMEAAMSDNGFYYGELL